MDIFENVNLFSAGKVLYINSVDVVLYSSLCTIALQQS